MEKTEKNFRVSQYQLPIDYYLRYQSNCSTFELQKEILCWILIFLRHFWQHLKVQQQNSINIIASVRHKYLHGISPHQM